MNEARPTKEISLDALLGSYDYGGRRPQTAMEALMQAPPGVEPEESMEEVQPLREIIAQCIDLLSEQDQFVINAINSERVTLQELGDRLGVSRMHASRLRDAAFARLRDILEVHPVIRKRVDVADTWEQSAMQWVGHLSRIADESEKIRIGVLENLVDRAWANAMLDDTGYGHTTLWTAVGCAAIRELRLRECWDGGRMVSTLVSKQNAYGHGNINKFGTVGILVRLSDKVQRYKNLTERNTSPSWETLEDTLLDLVGYSVVGLMYDDGTFQLEVSTDYES